MKSLLMALMIMAFIVGCEAQEKEKTEQTESQGTEETVQPKGQWKVHRQYDDQGNLIRYDSIYSWSYSSKDGKSVTINLDSIMDDFRGYFDEVTPFDWKKDFLYFPEADSLLMKDFFKEDYFFNNWERHHDQLENMIKKMDSARNAFLRKYHPGLIDSADDEEQ